MYEILKQDRGIWELFTGQKECSSGQADRHQRLIYASNKDRDILNPVASQFLVEHGFEAKYPDGKKFAVCLTHDVDDIYPPLSHIILSSLCYVKKFDFNGLKSLLGWRRRGKEGSPYWNFREIMELEKKYNARSSFFFLATDKDIRRTRYDPAELQDELRCIAASGWEVGLHVGYYSYDRLEEIKKEKRKLEVLLDREVVGCRNHYLRFKTPDTWRLLAEAGLKYDTTYGCSDAVGFRNGMCHPFKPFDFQLDREINILEIPLVIMDCTLFSLVKSFPEAWEIAQRLIATVAGRRGVLTLLWHNNVFTCPFREGWKELYEKILRECYRREAWLTSAGEIWRWCISGC